MAERKQSELTVAINGRLDPSLNQTFGYTEQELRKLKQSWATINRIVDNQGSAAFRQADREATAALQHLPVVDWTD